MEGCLGMALVRWDGLRKGSNEKQQPCVLMNCR